MIDVADDNAIYHQDDEGHYYNFDEFGSIVVISDVNNLPLEHYAYDIFGRSAICDAISTVVGESAYELKLDD